MILYGQAGEEGALDEETIQLQEEWIYGEVQEYEGPMMHVRDSGTLPQLPQLPGGQNTHSHHCVPCHFQERMCEDNSWETWPYRINATLPPRC